MSSQHYEKEFFDHITKYQVDIKDGAEFIHRLEIFANNMEQIHKHNADTTQTYQLGQNQFTHLTFDEFVKAVNLNGINKPTLRKNSGDVHKAPADVSALPASVDWVAAGAVTPVKNQGSCGSCWSFSTTGALEGAYQIKNGNLQSFSEQQLVSCDTTDAGCDGGWMDDAFAWVQSNGGITTEAAYPYTSGGGTNSACITGKTLVSGSAPSKYTDVTAGSVSALMSAVAQQPVSIAIQANQLAFQSYKSGVLTGKCGQRLDHGVLAVGYGTDTSTGKSLDYWKVKNSWGNTWGEGGYIRILRSDKDLCGVLDAASYPTL